MSRGTPSTPRLLPALVFSASAGVLVSSGVYAQLEEVIVTARKVEESLQEVPVAVSALSGEQLELTDTQNMLNLSNRVPNLHIPNNTVIFSAPAPYMRGAGRSEVNWNAENAVAIFIDDVYMQSTAASTIDMIDWESVEVLRGPQGTLYGRNATTGAIKFTPRRPELNRDDARFKATVTVGSNNRQDIKLSGSTALVENTLGVQVDIFRVADDGYLTLVDEANNELDDEFGHKERIGGRIGLLWAASDSLEVEFNVDGRVEDNGVTLLTPILPNDPTDFTQLLSKRGTVGYNPVFGPNRVAAQPLLRDGVDDGFDFTSWNAAFKVKWDTDVGTFKSITGYRSYDEDYSGQLGGRGVPSTAFGVTIGSVVESYNDFKQFTQEFQFTTSFGDNFDMTAGLYYFQNDWEQLQYNGVLLPVEFSPGGKPGATETFGGGWLDTFQDSESWAIYADATWQLTDAVAIFFGGRYLEDEKTVDYETRLENNVFLFPGFPVTANQKWTEFTPRIGVEWQINDDVMVYASYSEGFRSGVLEGARATDAVLASSWLDPEIVETSEIGIKADWFDSRLRTNITAFFSDYNDKGDLISPQEAAVADVEIDGLEAELNWAATEGLTLWATIGLMDAEYTGADADHPIFAPDPTGFAPGLDAEVHVTPEYSYSIGADYHHEMGDRGTLDFGISITGVDDHYNGLGVSNWDSEIVEGYETTNAHIRYTSGDERWSATLGGANIFDEEYWVSGFFGSIPEVSSRHYADGATWYLTLQYRMD